MGTRFGGLGEFTAAASTSRTVSRDGWTPSWLIMRSVLLAPRAHNCLLVTAFWMQSVHGVLKTMRRQQIVDRIH